MEFNTIKMRSYSLLILAIALLCAGCSNWDEHYIGSESDTQNLLERLKTVEEATELIQALESTGLDQVVAGSDVYTVFIPPVGSFSNANETELKSLVANHIVFGRYFKENLADSLVLRAVSGKFFVVSNTDGAPKVNNRISLLNVGETITDIEASNGVIHQIEQVIETVPNLEEQIQTLDPEKFSLFLEYYNKFDSINAAEKMYTLEFNDSGSVVLTEALFKEYVSFNAADEENGYTLLVPSDEAILKQKAELLELNGGDESKISPFYFARLIRNQMLLGAYNEEELFMADTIRTNGFDWVVGRKLDKNRYSTATVASNGYLFKSENISYHPIAADFIDSLVYEAEWSVGFQNHEKTLIYRSDLQPVVAGDGVNVDTHLFAPGLNGGNKLDFFIPNTFKGLYRLKMEYKWTSLRVLFMSENIWLNQSSINLETFVPRDLSNEDPNYWAYADFGEIYFPEDGNLNVGLYITSGMLEALMINKIVLVPLEY